MSRRTPRSRSARRGLVVAGCTIALVALTASALAITTASWTDRTHFAAEANAGTWDGGGGGPAPGEPARPGGISPGNDATVLDLRWQVQSSVQFCVDVAVTTASPDPIQWAVRVDTTQIPFNGRAPSQVQSAAVTHGPDAGGLMLLGGTSQTWNENRWISAGSAPVSVRICMWDPATAPAILPPGAETYAFATVLAPGASDWYACTVTTITGHAPTFYVGFEVTMSWLAVLDGALARGEIDQPTHTALAGRSLTNWYGGSGSWEATTDGDVVTVRGTNPWTTMGITAGQTIELRGCIS